MQNTLLAHLLLFDTLLVVSPVGLLLLRLLLIVAGGGRGIAGRGVGYRTVLTTMAATAAVWLGQRGDGSVGAVRQGGGRGGGLVCKYKKQFYE
jgi:hypothetical protein